MQTNETTNSNRNKRKRTTAQSKSKSNRHPTMSSSAVTTPSLFGGMSLPMDIQRKLESGSFRAVCRHLRERSDAVSNIDLMTISGFCRNCLAKWLVVEARRMSDENEDENETRRLLDGLGYDEAAEEVYGCAYSQWKERHSKKATEEQMQRYQASTPLHTQLDKNLLAKRNGGHSSSVAAGSPNYYRTIPESVRTMLEAGAFRSLVVHLQERSDLVANIDLMTVSGFCRNCLAKWLVVEARNLSSQLTVENSQICETLDEFGYNEAAKEVYGCAYSEWKKRHSKKASNEQMERYNASAPLHAQHDAELLKVRSKGQSTHSNTNANAATSPIQASSLLSDVCCQDVDATNPSTNETTICIAPAPTPINATPPPSRYVPPPPPRGGISVSVGILTVSDRAAANQYESGDLSGPSVERSLMQIISSLNEKTTADRDLVACTITEKTIVPDDLEVITQTLLSWCQTSNAIGGNKDSNNDNTTKNGPPDLVFTTGGTGFAPRDVTPEATRKALDREMRGLVEWAQAECAVVQSLATLSRGTAGICGRTIVVNLPGNPNGVGQVLGFLFPLLLHAVEDLRGGG